jgi:hypothetical protein
MDIFFNLAEITDPGISKKEGRGGCMKIMQNALLSGILNLEFYLHYYVNLQ